MEHKLYRRWFTLFFIPVIPLDELDRFYECDSCKSAYNENVKSLLTQSAESQKEQQSEAKKLFGIAVIASMMHMAMIDDDYAKEEEREINDMIDHFPENKEELQALAEKIRVEGNKDNQVFNILNSARNQLSSEALLNILAQAGVVLLADGKIEKEEEDLMKDYLVACGLPKDMYRTIIDKLQTQQLAKDAQSSAN